MAPATDPGFVQFAPNLDHHTLGLMNAYVNTTMAVSNKSHKTSQAAGMEPPPPEYKDCAAVTPCTPAAAFRQIVITRLDRMEAGQDRIEAAILEIQQQLQQIRDQRRRSLRPCFKRLKVKVEILVIAVFLGIGQWAWEISPCPYLRRGFREYRAIKEQRQHQQQQERQPPPSPPQQQQQQPSPPQ
ncbi:hypothetical protein CONLIGDRAFT_642445 [Coniochaeta ligniaria NRRL 30616]|uniref:Uncharacterized protein n=1 Tax=Coniochaeta ligniaria NRRL 30616 TaxID=1408157 RepID=A0A1J7JRZ2_9PEZI|nr:hypothetical protein CONLIGDRAFT_642445 [Coniochaeta ligniaria NRRL 30616]